MNTVYLSPKDINNLADLIYGLFPSAVDNKSYASNDDDYSEKSTSNPSAHKCSCNKACKNAYLPPIEHVIFNLKTQKTVVKKDANGKETRVKQDLENPVLTTVVYFSDNTKVTVQNSVHDRVNVVEKTLSNGKTIKVADDASKEMGLAYAITKRMLGTKRENGVVESNGLGRILKDIIESAYDQTYETAQTNVSRQERKAKYEAQKANAKPKTPRMSLAKAVDRLTDVVEKLEAKATK